MPMPFWASVGVNWADRAAVESAVQDWVHNLKLLPTVQRVIWYGSWIAGTPGPRSDVDICLIVSDAAPTQRDRASQFLPVGFPTGIDLVVFTAAEWGRLSDVAPAWHAAIAAGREL